jgi:hypothetical protein
VPVGAEADLVRQADRVLNPATSRAVHDTARHRVGLVRVERDAVRALDVDQQAPAED